MMTRNASTLNTRNGFEIGHDVRQHGLDPQTTALEHEIDQLVYKLYELTEEEIAIVERTNK